MKNKAVELVTRMRKNMKAVKYSDLDKILLRKRSLVETVFGYELLRFLMQNSD